MLNTFLSVDEDPGDSGDEYEDEPLNPLVEALFDELETLRIQVRSHIHLSIRVFLLSA